MRISLTVSANWNDYTKLLDIRDSSKSPELAFYDGKLGINGDPKLWDKEVREFINDLLSI